MYVKNLKIGCKVEKKKVGQKHDKKIPASAFRIAHFLKRKKHFDSVFDKCMWDKLFFF